MVLVRFVGGCGFFIGDLLLFQSYMVIGSRTAALIMSLAPMLTAVIGWFFLDETLSALNILQLLSVWLVLSLQYRTTDET